LAVLFQTFPVIIVMTSVTPRLLRAVRGGMAQGEDCDLLARMPLGLLVPQIEVGRGIAAILQNDCFAELTLYPIK
jgi:hypothetical protein